MAGVHLMALAPRVHLSSSAPSRLGRTALMVSASSLQNHRPLLLQQQHLRSPDLVELEYADLKLKEKVGEVGHVRIRQHVNPLSASFSTSPEIPNWDGVFEDPKLPLMVDIGSGSGRFLMWLAKKHPQSRNYLGLEIREKLVKRAQFWVKELSLKNIHFMFANATVAFKELVSAYPGPLIAQIHISRNVITREGCYRSPWWILYWKVWCLVDRFSCSQMCWKWHMK
ncbi:uncharacterized protein LOC116253703 isoform X3 [Nymphaea colorata]|uniref:uncharacterized protein LOC116253703 isoform X3 n=1 Tax=Nymphaea colorata TaxID=210225 RepID=UPI00129DBEA6|nr:uncharacterized protein LOC116253703 isoform X3 [Nymphaea colorata]